MSIELKPDQSQNESTFLKYFNYIYDSHYLRFEIIMCIFYAEVFAAQRHFREVFW